MKFKKIVAIDYTGIDEFVHENLVNLCDELVMHDNIPDSEETIIKRAEGADAILVSWNTQITENVLKDLPNLKYIGMCCSLYDESTANVNIAQARKQNIIVKGIKDYGDDGVVEFIISELIRLLSGTGNVQWKDEAVELKRVKLGIIGLGTLGLMVARAAQYFGMEVFYHNRNKRNDINNNDIVYLPLEDLLSTCDVISTHLPKNTVVLEENEFKAFGENKILINTSLSPSYSISAFEKWMDRGNNFAIFDTGGTTDELRSRFELNKRLISTLKVTGFTKNARERLARKAVENLKEVLEEIK